jgi:hypothetical protein
MYLGSSVEFYFSSPSSDTGSNPDFFVAKLVAISCQLTSTNRFVATLCQVFTETIGKKWQRKYTIIKQIWKLKEISGRNFFSCQDYSKKKSGLIFRFICLVTS